MLKKQQGHSLQSRRNENCFFMFRKIRKSLVSAVLEGRSGQYGLKKKKQSQIFFFFTEQFQFLVN